MSRPIGSKNRSDAVLDKELMALVKYVNKAPKKGRSFTDMKRFVSKLPTCTTAYENNPLAVHLSYLSAWGINKAQDGRYYGIK